MLQNKLNNNLKLIFDSINLKKKYLKSLDSRIKQLKFLKSSNPKSVRIRYKTLQGVYSDKPFVMYIVHINFSKSNTFMHVTDCLGNMKFFYSSGSFSYKGKSKMSRASVLSSFYKIIHSKLKFLKRVPVAVHFRNSGFSTRWFLKKLKKRLFITTVKFFVSLPHNGCRQRKLRRKR